MIHLPSVRNISLQPIDLGCYSLYSPSKSLRMPPPRRNCRRWKKVSTKPKAPSYCPFLSLPWDQQREGCWELQYWWSRRLISKERIVAKGYGQCIRLRWIMNPTGTTNRECHCTVQDRMRPIPEGHGRVWSIAKGRILRLPQVVEVENPWMKVVLKHVALQVALPPRFAAVLEA